MAYEVERHDDHRAAVVHISGDIDIAVVPDLKAGLQDLTGAGVSNFVLELSGVEYADSSALGLLVWLDHELSGTSGKVVLVGATRNVSRVLEISGLVSVAEAICAGESVDDALQGLEIVGEDVAPQWMEQFSMPASAESLAPIRERVCGVVAPLKYSDAALFDIKVALGEALANAVRHGSPAGGDSPVVVRVRAYDDRVAIDVEDTGGGFNGESMCSDDLYASGGRGIMFMRALMDRVVFSTSADGGTVVTLVKHRAPVESL
ncbi:MAG: anti-sigma factor antagonist [Coriobacteriia bacterium]|nr:anti-sigma factor antagonist [Coriobacteriia bacterium]